MSSLISIWKDNYQKWADIDICQPLIFGPDHGTYCSRNDSFNVIWLHKQTFSRPLGVV